MSMKIERFTVALFDPSPTKNSLPSGLGFWDACYSGHGTLPIEALDDAIDQCYMSDDLVPESYAELENYALACSREPKWQRPVTDVIISDDQFDCLWHVILFIKYSV